MEPTCPCQVLLPVPTKLESCLELACTCRSQGAAAWYPGSDLHDLKSAELICQASIVPCLMQSGGAGQVELPSCPVCLEKLDESAGIVTTVWPLTGAAMGCLC